jgi:hypothetical protein
MLLWLFGAFICVCIGGSAAALIGYPLYWGFLAGWLALPSLIVMMMMPCIIRDNMTKTRPWQSARRMSYPPLAGQRQKHHNESVSVC